MSGCKNNSNTSSSPIGSDDTAKKRKQEARKPLRIVIKRRKKNILRTSKVPSPLAVRRDNRKRGIPNNLARNEWSHTVPPPDESTAEQQDNNDEDNDDLFSFPPLEDAIPCDTLLAFQSLTTTTSSSSSNLLNHQCLTIPLVASMHPIPCILESQLVPTLQQDWKDHNSFEMVHEELADLLHKNVLRRLTSAGKNKNNNSSDVRSLTVLLLTEEYIRGVWDAHDSYHPRNSEEQEQEQHRHSIVTWFVSHLHCWTGRILSEAQLQHQWTTHPPQTNIRYATTSSSLSSSSSLTRAIEYLQQIQVLLPNHHGQQPTTYQLWLPQWGQVLAAFTSAHKKFLLKIRQTYQKEISEKSFLVQPYYKGISSKLLLQWLQDQGVVTLVPKPYGNFITLVDKKKKSK
jgi:hypothetical protein